MSHLEKMYFLRWVKNSKNISTYISPLAFQNVIMDTWNEKISNQEIDGMLEFLIKYHCRNFKFAKENDTYYNFLSSVYKKKYLNSFFDMVNEYCDYLIKEKQQASEEIEKKPTKIEFPQIDR
ncbi:2446_t:CDS:1 [Gigaspora margarita]|uniref:2446_t:CDS:1 n=1 Tax=Gigaspora margarita TaxID=4874 RepID=A0ABN7WFF7_GIGMA|nr:2446_t:CDS:1 [Gigaspora margarita]